MHKGREGPSRRIILKLALQDAQHGEVGRYCTVLGWICRLNLLFAVREMSQFEAEPGKLKPLLGGAFRGFAGRKSVQHGAVEMS